MADYNGTLSLLLYTPTFSVFLLLKIIPSLFWLQSKIPIYFRKKEILLWNTESLKDEENRTSESGYYCVICA